MNYDLYIRKEEADPWQYIATLYGCLSKDEAETYARKLISERGSVLWKLEARNGRHL